MKLDIDSDVAKIAYYMTRVIPAYKLQSIAHGLAQLSDIAFAHLANQPTKFRLCQVEWDDEADSLIVDELSRLNAKSLARK